MSHELTHVVQQGAAERGVAQAKLSVGDANSPAEHEADAVAAKLTGGQASFFVVDGAAPSAEYMSRDQFLKELRESVTDTADAALGMFWSAVGCPYIRQWFAKHEHTDARSLELLARKYSRVQAPKSARLYRAHLHPRRRRHSPVESRRRCVRRSCGRGNGWRRAGGRRDSTGRRGRRPGPTETRPARGAFAARSRAQQPRARRRRARRRLATGRRHRLAHGRRPGHERRRRAHSYRRGRRGQGERAERAGVQRRQAHRLRARPVQPRHAGGRCTARARAGAHGPAKGQPAGRAGHARRLCSERQPRGARRRRSPRRPVKAVRRRQDRGAQGRRRGHGAVPHPALRRRTRGSSDQEDQRLGQDRELRW